MKTRRASVGLPVLALTVIVIVLAAGFAYYYTTTQSQIANLKKDNGAVCQVIQSAAGAVGTTYSAVESSLQARIANDTAAIAQLNSTKPGGYQATVTALTAEVALDQAVLNQMTGLNSPSISSRVAACGAYL
jgi:hypothetical protein